jgi:hypothetical protein
MSDNPYQSPQAPLETIELPEKRVPVDPPAETPYVSAFMVFAGLLFFVGSLYPLLGNGLKNFLTSYDQGSRVPCAIMIFYGFAGLLTSVFHFSYILTHWPRQHLASVYAFGIALLLTAGAILTIEFII